MNRQTNLSSFGSQSANLVSNLGWSSSWPPSYSVHAGGVANEVCAGVQSLLVCLVSLKNSVGQFFLIKSFIIVLIIVLEEDFPQHIAVLQDSLGCLILAWSWLVEPYVAYWDIGHGVVHVTVWVTLL